MKPNPEELTRALGEAKRMREQGQDPYHLAKTVLNLNYRQHYYEQLRQALERFIHSGESEVEHMHLLKALEHVQQLDERSAGEANEDLGLG